MSLCNPFNLIIADEDFRKGFNIVYDKALANALCKIFKRFNCISLAMFRYYFLVYVYYIQYIDELSGMASFAGMLFYLRILEVSLISLWLLMLNLLETLMRD